MNTREQSKSLALMFLLGAFLTGGALGFVADRAVSRNRTYSRQYDQSSIREIVARELALDAPQRRHVDSVFDWRRQEYRKIMSRVTPSVDSLLDVANEKIVAVLSTEQKRRFYVLRDSMRALDSAKSRPRPQPTQ